MGSIYGFFFWFDKRNHLLIQYYLKALASVTIVMSIVDTCAVWGVTAAQAQNTFRTNIFGRLGSPAQSLDEFVRHIYGW
jgi:hypothetical protein